MRCFNLISHFIARYMWLAGVCCAPAICLATEPLPQERPPRSGATVVTLPGLSAVMQEVVRQPGSSVALHYPESEDGEAWVDELREWLVALGLSSNRIQVIPGGSGDMVNIIPVNAMRNPADAQASTPSRMAEPFHIEEAAEAANEVEIP